MDNLILSFNVVFPLFIFISLGYFLKYKKIILEKTVSNMNKVTFKVFIPTLLFNNIYTTKIEDVFNLKLILFSAISVISIFFLTYSVVLLYEKENKKRGVLIQGIFRSNFVLFGIPVTALLYGDKNIGVSSLLVAIVVPLFNIFSVVALETFRGGKINIKNILKGVVANPLIIGSLIGIMALLFKINLPSPIEKSISDIGKIATPLALILLGASFNFSQIKSTIKNTLFATIGKLIVVPSIIIPICVYMGYRNIELVSFMTIFASPTAVASFTMAQQMDGDSTLAGQIVVFTSTFSIITVFLWIFILKTLELI